MSGQHIRKSRHVEAWVEELFVQMNFRLLSANQRLAGVEIDRVFENPDGDLVLCEIKTMSDWNYIMSRVHERQKRRLRRAQALMASWRPRQSVLLYFCFFHIESGILRVYDDLGEFITELRADFVGLD